jgi:hypothetical protein
VPGGAVVVNVKTFSFPEEKEQCRNIQKLRLSRAGARGERDGYASQAKEAGSTAEA